MPQTNGVNNVPSKTGSSGVKQCTIIRLITSGVRNALKNYHYHALSATLVIRTVETMCARDVGASD